MSREQKLSPPQSSKMHTYVSSTTNSIAPLLFNCYRSATGNFLLPSLRSQALHVIITQTRGFRDELLPAVACRAGAFTGYTSLIAGSRHARGVIGIRPYLRRKGGVGRLTTGFIDATSRPRSWHRHVYIFCMLRENE